MMDFISPAYELTVKRDARGARDFLAFMHPIHHSPTP
jgi:hypothetical protein